MIKYTFLHEKTSVKCKVQRPHKRNMTWENFCSQNKGLVCLSLGSPLLHDLEQLASVPLFSLSCPGSALKAAGRWGLGTYPPSGEHGVLPRHRVLGCQMTEPGPHPEAPLLYQARGPPPTPHPRKCRGWQRALTGSPEPSGSWVEAPSSAVLSVAEGPPSSMPGG